MHPSLCSMWRFHGKSYKTPKAKAFGWVGDEKPQNNTFIYRTMSLLYNLKINFNRCFAAFQRWNQSDCGQQPPHKQKDISKCSDNLKGIRHIAALKVPSGNLWNQSYVLRQCFSLKCLECVLEAFSTCWMCFLPHKTFSEMILEEFESFHYFVGNLAQTACWCVTATVHQWRVQHEQDCVPWRLRMCTTIKTNS